MRKCKHPIEKSTLKNSFYIPERRCVTDPYNYQYMVNTRLCGKCGKYFIDEGFEFIERG